MTRQPTDDYQVLHDIEPAFAAVLDVVEGGMLDEPAADATARPVAFDDSLPHIAGQ